MVLNSFWGISPELSHRGIVSAGAKFPNRRNRYRLSNVSSFSGPGPNAAPKRYFPQRRKERIMGRGILLWLMGVPLSVIILIALFTNFI
jgi:hypothetical protein